MMSDCLTVSRDHENTVVRVQLNRPDRGNAFSAGLVADFSKLMADLHDDQSIRLLVISGAGRNFCTGFDLSNLDQETDDSLLARFVRVELLLQQVANAPFATLALAHGRAMGIGADLFAACAERWIVDDASFVFPGTGFGLILGTARLLGLVGRVRAARWVEGGLRVDTQLALASGLATRKIGQSDTEAAVEELVARVSRLDGVTQRMVRDVLTQDRASSSGAAADRDLARLVRSAARLGLKARIVRYRQRTTRQRVGS